jgi:hypothetical protein
MKSFWEVAGLADWAETVAATRMDASKRSVNLRISPD